MNYLMNPMKNIQECLNPNVNRLASTLVLSTVSFDLNCHLLESEERDGLDLMEVLGRAKLCAGNTAKFSTYNQSCGLAE